MKKLTGRVATQAKTKTQLKRRPRESLQEESEEDFPTISSSKIRSVESVLTKSTDITGEQADTLANLTFSNGETILSMEYPWFVYEMVWLVKQLGYQDAYDYLSGSKPQRDWIEIFGEHNIRKKMLFESPLMERNKDKLYADMTVYQQQVDVEMGEPCKRCGSENTVAIGKQSRSADEAETIKIWCGSCGFRWTAQ